MNFKPYIYAVIASGLSMFILAGVWHELLMAHFYESEAHASHGGTGIIFVSYFILASLMVFFYMQSFKKRPSLLSNLKFGIFMGLLWVFPHELAMAGAHDTSIIYVIKNAAWHMVEQGIGGIVLGVVFWKVV